MIIKFKLEQFGNGHTVSNEDYTVNPKTGLPNYEIDQFGASVKHDETFSVITNACLMLDVGENYDPDKMNVFVNMIGRKLAELSSKKMKKTHHDWDERTIPRPRTCHIADVDHLVGNVIVDYNFSRECVVYIPPRPPSHCVKLHIADLVNHVDTNDWADLTAFLRSESFSGTYRVDENSGTINFNPTQEEFYTWGHGPYKNVLIGKVSKFQSQLFDSDKEQPDEHV